jgi:hypothetical protein
MSVTGLLTEVTSLDLHKRSGGSPQVRLRGQSVDFIENSHIGCTDEQGRAERAVARSLPGWSMVETLEGFSRSMLCRDRRGGTSLPDRVGTLGSRQFINGWRNNVEGPQRVHEDRRCCDCSGGCCVGRNAGRRSNGDGWAVKGVKALAFDAAFPDVKPGLESLRKQGVKLAILPKMLEAAAKSAGIRDLLDDVIRVDEVKIFKVSPRVYNLALSA